MVGYVKDTTRLLGRTASIVEEVNKHVMAKEVGTIHVYGMAGSGKTAVVLKANNFIVSEYCKSITASRDGKILITTTEMAKNVLC